MSNPAKKKKNQVKPIAKPYLKGNVLSRLSVVRGIKLWLYPLIFILINLFIGAAFSFDGLPILRIPLNLILILFTIFLVFNNGQNTGYGDITLAEIMYNHQQEGKPVSPKDLDRCYHPLKGVVTALIGYLPFLILALIYALTAQKQQYSLPALPSWLSSYENQSAIMAPLAYYQTTETLTAASILRVVMRLMLFPYINLAGSRNTEMMLLVDRLSPVALFLPFLGYILGYLLGRNSRAMVHGSIAAADRKRRRKTRQQQRKPRNKTELI